MEPFHIGGQIAEGTDNAIFDAVARKIANGYRELTLTINSTGGCVGTSIAIYSMLRSLPIPVTTYVIGTCQSAAVLIFLAGSKRLITPSSTLMTHGPARQTSQSITLEVAEQIVEALKCDHHAMATIISERLGIDHDGALQYILSEHWFSAEEATKAKFATEISELCHESPILR
ncbi:MAG TPA: hypothetical protein DEQ20_08170 [Desulfobulbaceae bacterium]|nr:MAG: hypothetical protein A2520_01915 [Deltaproteobacteria bacterium RIFOXYD12_FULL_53_23]HCC54881.1 hypothetical protein [Desulfobulbaceae bacterium]